MKLLLSLIAGFLLASPLAAQSQPGWTYSGTICVENSLGGTDCWIWAKSYCPSPENPTTFACQAACYQDYLDYIATLPNFLFSAMTYDHSIPCNGGGNTATLLHPEEVADGYAYPESMSWAEIEAAEDGRTPNSISTEVTNIGWRYKVTCQELENGTWSETTVMRTVCPDSEFFTTLLCEIEAKDRVQAVLDAMEDYMVVNIVIDTPIACPGGPTT